MQLDNLVSGIVHQDKSALSENLAKAPEWSESEIPTYFTKHDPR